MRLKMLSKGKLKKIVIIFMFISIIGVIFINRNNKTEKLVIKSEEILNDNSSVAINIETGLGTGVYNKGTVPESGYYKVNTSKSYCTIGSSKDEIKTIPMEYKDGNVYIGITDEATKCYVWLDVYEPNAKDTADRLGLKLGSGTPNFGKRSCKAGSNNDVNTGSNCEEDTYGVYETTDDFGTSYYYRGTLDNADGSDRLDYNNWVKFGKANGEDIWWRIIRINGNGTIRMIFSGIGGPKTYKDNEGKDTQIAINGNIECAECTKAYTLVYNKNYNNAKYVKYKYDSTSKDNGIDSTIKEVLDKWYKKYLLGYDDKIDLETGFCNDADKGVLSGSYQYFKAFDRVLTYCQPTLMCETPKINLFTVSGEKGNNLLSYPIGLITIDEAALAGGTRFNNFGYWLYTGQYYWTMTPYSFSGNDALMFDVDGAGTISGIRVNYTNIDIGVRPVINLRADTQFKDGGLGTSVNPYEVV